MKPYSYFLLLCLLCASLALAACGPKNVGEDVVKADDGYTHAGREPETQLRYPVSGSRLDQRLYYMNQPQVMIETMQRQKDHFNRRAGITPKDGQNEYHNLTPKQQSPFRF